jgi:hypothetical protein
MLFRPEAAIVWVIVWVRRPFVYGQRATPGIEWTQGQCCTGRTGRTPP